MQKEDLCIQMKSCINKIPDITLCFLSLIVVTRYDYQAGFWGVMGHPCLGIIPVSFQLISSFFSVV